MVEPQARKRWTVFFAGHVQAVGFRYTTRRIADSYPVTGYVRNRADGRVELVVEGEDAVVREFVEQIQSTMAAQIEMVEMRDEACRDEFTEFAIRV